MSHTYSDINAFTTSSQSCDQISAIHLYVAPGLKTCTTNQKLNLPSPAVSLRRSTRLWAVERAKVIRGPVTTFPPSSLAHTWTSPTLHWSLSSPSVKLVTEGGVGRVCALLYLENCTISVDVQYYVNCVHV